ncbi:hypothetical protein QMT40_001763 [Parvibaculaceae bacterium PLY_AMNH_Bact1]|nr:hypothetical protein QMT40_001763 [Parvibaculaceae bacterium PLY_AMNH_Bact1]
MKQTPIRLEVGTLGDLMARREDEVIGGLLAWCHSRSCDVQSVPLDLNALARERGPNYDWKRLKAVCTECGSRDTSISLLWTHTKHITYGHHGSRTPNST